MAAAWWWCPLAAAAVVVVSVGGGVVGDGVTVGGGVVGDGVTVGVGVPGVGVGSGGGVGDPSGNNVIGLLVPVMEGLLVSVAVMVWVPDEPMLALKIALPLVNVLSAGRFAFPAVLVKCTVPV